MPPFKKPSIFTTKKQSFLAKIASEIPFFNLLLFSLFICIGTIAALIFLKDHIPPQVPLFYGLPEGEEQLTSTTGLTIPSFVALIVIVVNTILATIFENNFVRNSLVLTSFAVTLFATITTIKVLFLVGSF
jgi:hypothetical protein